jgi:hypothetical protein
MEENRDVRAANSSGPALPAREELRHRKNRKNRKNPIPFRHTSILGWSMSIS